MCNVSKKYLDKRWIGQWCPRNVESFVYSHNAPINVPNAPIMIYIKFDDPDVSHVLQLSKEHCSILIEHISVKFFGSQNSVFEMIRFPLISCNASTVHKVQRLSTKAGVTQITTFKLGYSRN